MASIGPFIELLEQLDSDISDLEHSSNVPGFFVSLSGKIVEIKPWETHESWACDHPDVFGYVEEDMSASDVFDGILLNWMMVRKWARPLNVWTIAFLRFNTRTKRAIEHWADYVLNKFPNERDETVMFEPEFGGRGWRFTVGQIAAGYLDVEI